MPQTPARTRPVRLGPYDLVEPLAKGAMGEVWRGRHRRRGVPVAVKCLLDHGREDLWAETSFANEIRAAAGLDHPGIVVIIDHGVIDARSAGASDGRLEEGGPYLVMELLDGRPLHDLVGRIDWPTLRDVLRQLLAALAHSHARGVIHRDLKPGNILVEPRLDAAQRRTGWHARITDFGLAQAIDQHTSVPGVVAGTPAYMAPEQLQGDWRDQGPWTDLYSLGCLAWAMVTGQPPFGRQRAFADVSLDHLHRPPPPLAPQFEVPEAFEGWLRRLLEKDPAGRYASAADAAQALDDLPDTPTLEPETAAHDPREDGPLVMGAYQGAAAFDEDTTGAPAERVGGVPEVSTQVLPDDIPMEPSEVWAHPEGRAPLPLTRIEVPEGWQVDGADNAAHRLSGIGLSLYGLRTIPMVDRVFERTRVWEGLHRVETQGKAHLIVLRGPAGSGKTRLAEWLGETAHELAGATVLRARHSVSGEPGSGLADMLARQLRCTGLPRAEVLQRVEHLVQRTGLVDADEAVALTELLSPATPADLEADAPVVRFGSPRERFALIRRVLERLDPTPRPVVLVIDDAQWGSEALSFSEWLLQTQNQHPAPIFIVLTAQEVALAERPDAAVVLERLSQRDDTRVVEVGPLPREAHAQLVRALLGMDGELVSRVTRRTAGNPLFAVQLVGDWVSRGVLERGDRGFRLKKGEKVHIPDDLHAVWRSRVERLLEGHGDAEARALELAATLGDKVDNQEWRALCARLGIRADLRRLLGRLLVLRLARVDAAGGGWLFGHPMLRESLVRHAQEAGRSAESHRACASMLEVRHGRQPGLAERIAWHLVEAGDDRDALSYLLEAAQERVTKGDLSIAERILDERAAALQRLEVSLDDPIWADSWFLRLRVLRVQGRTEEAEPYVEEAIVSARINGWRDVLARARIQQGLLLYRRGHFLRAWRRLRQAEQIAAEIGDVGTESYALHEQGRVMIERGRLQDAEELLQRALDGFVRADRGADRASSNWLLGRVAKQRGDLDGAMSRFQAALTAFEANGARWGVATSTNELGEVARLQGALDRAEALYRDALARMDELGADDAQVVRINLAQVLLNRARYDEAGPLLLTTLRAFEGSEHRAMVGIIHALMLVCAAAAADWEAWDRHRTAAIEVLTATGWVEHDVALAARQAGDLALEAGETDRAREAWSMARLQWVTLNRPDEVAETTRRIEGIADASEG